MEQISQWVSVGSIHNLFFNVKGVAERKEIDTRKAKTKSRGQMLRKQKVSKYAEKEFSYHFNVMENSQMSQKFPLILQNVSSSCA